jgi:phosphoribosylcarboxyaminoimidazole (NCAIR) mutase
MGLAVVTVVAGGLPVVDVTATTPGLGVPVTEAVNGVGLAVTKVTLPRGGVPVTYVAATLMREKTDAADLHANRTNQMGFRGRQPAAKAR